MKKVALLFFFLLLVHIVSAQTYPQTCLNERLDRNEIGIDCGGVCRSCTLEDLEKTQRLLYPNVVIYEKQISLNATQGTKEDSAITLSTPFSTFESDVILKNIVTSGEIYVIPAADIKLSTFSTPSLKEVKVLIGDLIELRGINALSKSGESSPQFKINIKMSNQTMAEIIPIKKFNYPLIILGVASALWFLLLLFYWQVYKDDIKNLFGNLFARFKIFFENVKKMQARYLLAQLWATMEKEDGEKARILLKKLESKYRKIKKKDPTMTANLEELRRILK